MHKILYIFIISCLMVACGPYTEEQELFDVPISLMSDEPVGENYVTTITITSDIHGSYSQTITGSAVAHFRLPAGIYHVTASGIFEDEYRRIVWNGNMEELIVGNTPAASQQNTFSIALHRSTMDLSNPLLIKELYVGGCQKNNGSGKFLMDKCIILYNNSAYPKSLDGVCIGMVEPYNAEASSHLFLHDGILDYEADGWIPAINGYWYFRDGEVLAPYSELVVSMNGAIDNTPTYTNSVNYANAAYYAMYDPETTASDGSKYNNASYYAAPSYLIPEQHLLKAVKYGSGNAWPVSGTSPAMILFQVKDTTPTDFIIGNIVFPEGRQGNLSSACARIPRSWVLDAVEVFNAQSSVCKKRLTPDLDNGSIELTGGYGHSLIRKSHVNASGNIVYEDTNNSSNDFVEIDNCTLRK